MTRNIPRLLLMGALLFPATLYALGLGEIHLNSALSQPFDAEVELLSVTPEELASLKVSLASAESFERAGLDRAAFLTSFNFRVDKAGNGRNVIRITSARSISEPVVSLLLEASWGNGRVQREYTVFLDPPVFVPVQPATSTIQEPLPVAPTASDQSRTQGVIERPAEPAPAPEPAVVPPPTSPTSPTAETVPSTTPAPEPTSTIAPVPPTAEVATPEPMPEPSAAVPAPESVPAPTVSADTYDVKRNDSLWKIATRLRPGTPQSINQTMIALYRANPSAFAGNINRLRAGAVLRVPAPQDIEAVDMQGATAEVARQYSEWRPAAAAESEREHLRLITPQEPAVPVESAAQAAERTKQAEAEKAAEQAKTAEAERVAAAAKKMSEEAEAKRLLELKNAELARMQREREAADAAKSAEAAKAAEASKAAEPTPAEPVAEVAPAPAEPAEAVPAETQPAPAPAAADEPSLTDTLAALPWTMIAGGVGVFALLVGWFVYSRRRQQAGPSSLHFPMPDASVPTMTPSDFDAAMGEPTKTRSRSQPAFDSGVMDEPESIPEAEGTKPLHSGAPPDEYSQAAAPVARSSRSADDTMSSETAVHVDQQDAVAEADFHMAYGLYDQAADLVKIAIGREPKRRDLKLKLLEIYFVWGNKELFLEAARDLNTSRAQAPAGEWDKILIMGKQIAPDDPIFRGGSVGSAGDMLDVNLEGGENRVDFDLFSAPDAGESESASLDFEIGNTGSRAKPSSHLDFLLDDSGSAQIADDDTREMDSNARTQETPTIESPVLRRNDARESTVEVNFGDHSAEQTAELSIDDLGLDVSSLEGTGSLERTTALIGARADTLQGNDDISDDEMTRIAPAAALPPKGKSPSSLEPTMEMPQVKLDASRSKSGNGHAKPVDDDDGDEVGVSTIYLEQMESPGGDVVETLGPRTDETAHMLSPSDLDLDLAQFGETDASDEDTIRTKARKHAEDATAEMPAMRSRPDTAATAEQPRPKIDRSDMLVATSELSEMEPVTMSEVGTKLDLARAYMDMGDPDGARSILEEVLGEGNSGQRAEAQRLLDSIR